MATFTPVIKQLMLDGILNGPGIPRISVAGLLFLWFAAVLTVLGAGFLFYAEYAFVTTSYTPEIAALAVTLTAWAAGLLSAIVGISIVNNNRNRRSHHAGPAPDIAKTVTALIDSIAEELEDPIRDNPKTAVMIASLAGFLAGDNARH